jgi:hypothetical protein
MNLEFLCLNKIFLFKCFKQTFMEYNLIKAYIRKLTLHNMINKILTLYLINFIFKQMLMVLQILVNFKFQPLHKGKFYKNKLNR